MPNLTAEMKSECLKTFSTKAVGPVPFALCSFYKRLCLLKIDYARPYIWCHSRHGQIIKLVKHFLHPLFALGGQHHLQDPHCHANQPRNEVTAAEALPREEVLTACANKVRRLLCVCGAARVSKSGASAPSQMPCAPASPRTGCSPSLSKRCDEPGGGDGLRGLYPDYQALIVRGIWRLSYVTSPSGHKSR